MRGFFFGVVIIIVFLPSLATAHPGKTDRRGGHVCRKDCSEWDLYVGEYHLHDEDDRPLRIEKKAPPGPVQTAEDNVSTGGIQPVGPIPLQTDNSADVKKAVPQTLPPGPDDHPAVRQPVSEADIYPLNQPINLLSLLLMAFAFIMLLAVLLIRKR
jgi:hypothetical protein